MSVPAMLHDAVGFERLPLANSMPTLAKVLQNQCCEPRPLQAIDVLTCANGLMAPLEKQRPSSCTGDQHVLPPPKARQNPPQRIIECGNKNWQLAARRCLQCINVLEQ
jgi:hypothetical protein